MTQLSLVSFYVKKPPQLVDLINDLQNQLSSCLKTHFFPYRMAQVHGTIIGLECFKSEQGLMSRWFKENQQVNKMIDCHAFSQFLASQLFEPFELKVGGWDVEQNYHFTSNEQHPFLRSFSIQGEIAVAMGWPVENQLCHPALYQIRRKFEQVNFLHKWHRADYQDNDFFFVLGRINKTRISSIALDQVLHEMRTYLSKNETRFTIAQENLSIVVYDDPQLPLESTQALSLSEVSQLEASQIEQLY